MKKILLFILLVVSFWKANAQSPVLQQGNINTIYGYGSIYSSRLQYIPASKYSTWAQYIATKSLPFIWADTLNSIFYWHNPFTNTDISLSGGGGGGSPAGNYGNIQINRNSTFSTPASDSLTFSSGTLITTGAMLSHGFSTYNAAETKSINLNAANPSIDMNGIGTTLHLGIANITSVKNLEYPNVSGSIAEGATNGLTTVHSNTSGVIDLSTFMALKVNISDTAAMLSPYLRSNIAAATYATIANLALKVNISDTATMLAHYLRSNIAAATYVPYTGATTNVQLGSNWLSGAQIGVGTGSTTPTGLLQTIETSTNVVRGIFADQYSTGTSSSRITMRKARGTFGSPTVIVTGDLLGRWGVQGYDGTSFVDAGAINITSTGTIGTGIVPTIMNLQTANSAGTLTTGFSMDAAQIVTLPHYTTAGGLFYADGSGVVSQTGAGTSTTVLHGGTTPTYGSVANADLTNSTITINGTSTALGGSFDGRPKLTTLTTSDTTTSSAMGNAANMSVTIVGSTKYFMKFMLKTTCSTVNGIKLGVTVNGSPTFYTGSCTGNNSSATNTKTFAITALDGTTNGTVNLYAGNGVATVEIIFLSGSGSTTAQLTFGSQTNTDTSIIVSGSAIITTILQ